jgi:hypothetical protein
MLIAKKNYPILYVDHTHSTNDAHIPAPPPFPETTDTPTGRDPDPDPEPYYHRTLPLGMRDSFKELFGFFSFLPADDDTIQHAHSGASSHD